MTIKQAGILILLEIKLPKVLTFTEKWYIIITATKRFVEQVTLVAEQTTKCKRECLLSDEEYVHSSEYISELKGGCILAMTRIDFMSKIKYDEKPCDFFARFFC